MPDFHVHGSRRSSLARFATPLLALLLLACGDATGILVEVRSTDLAVPDDINVLRFQVASSTGTSLDEAYVVTTDWPHSLTVVPASAADEDVTITVSGIRDGAMVIRRVVQVRFERGVTRRVEVVLSRDCVGVMCAPGIDCRAGSCMNVVPPDAGPRDAGPTDAGPVDGGTDAGPRDAGPDAGPRDAGPTDAGMDAGPIDGGTDAGPPDAGPPDAGPDAGGIVCTDSPAACQGVLVISEFAYEGAGGAADEFVELHNRGSAALDVGGVAVRYSSTSTSSLATRATLPAGTIVPPGGYYLVAAMSFTGGGADPGGTWTSGLSASRGSLVLAVGSTALDTVGWHGAESVRSEGEPLTRQDLEGGASFERKAQASSDATSMVSGADATAGNGYDSGDNMSDFVLRPARQPQNSASGTEP